MISKTCVLTKYLSSQKKTTTKSSQIWGGGMRPLVFSENSVTYWIVFDEGEKVFSFSSRPRIRFTEFSVLDAELSGKRRVTTKGREEFTRESFWLIFRLIWLTIFYRLCSICTFIKTKSETVEHNSWLRPWRRIEWVAQWIAPVPSWSMTRG